MKTFLGLLSLSLLLCGSFLLFKNHLKPEKKLSQIELFLKKQKTQIKKASLEDKKYFNSVRSIKFDPKSVVDPYFFYLKKLSKAPVAIKNKGKYLLEILIIPSQTKTQKFFNIQYDFIDLETKDTVHESIHHFYIDK